LDVVFDVDDGREEGEVRRGTLNVQALAEVGVKVAKAINRVEAIAQRLVGERATTCIGFAAAKVKRVSRGSEARRRQKRTARDVVVQLASDFNHVDTI